MSVKEEVKSSDSASPYRDLLGITIHLQTVIVFYLFFYVCE